MTAGRALYIAAALVAFAGLLLSVGQVWAGTVQWGWPVGTEIGIAVVLTVSCVVGARRTA